MFDYLLPVGTIVKLKESKKLRMIYGVRQKLSKTLVYDYLAVSYPEGYYNDDQRSIFMHSDIEEVIFRGFEDEKREDFIKFLEKSKKEVK